MPTDHPTEPALRVVAHGGGVQSTALLVLSAQGKIDFPVHLFCNTGDDSEHPATLEYVRNVSQPWAAERGITLHEIHKVTRSGEKETLMGRLMKEGSRSLPIPVRMPDTGAPGTRSCTADFKIRVISKWLKAAGATKDNPATVGIGISTDEIQRAGRGKDGPYERRTYPLIDLGLNRNQCHAIITAAGLPTPPKSACFFCPFHRPHTWAEMARDEPDLFEKSAALEDTLNVRRDMLGKDRVYLTRFGRPLRDAIGPAQDTFPMFSASEMDEGDCDEGVCFV
jgi:hypothetical protein